MNMKAVVVILLTAMTQGAFAENTPLTLKQALYDTTNLWGKASNTRQYYKARQECFDKIKGYADYATVMGEWQVSFFRFIKDNTHFDSLWMSEGVDEMFFFSHLEMLEYSTNCWFIAAEYAKKLTAIEKKAQLEYDQLSTSETFNMSETDRNIRATAWRHLVEAKYALGQTMRVVTNSYPQWILRKLPDEEGAVLYTNVLRRAGLVQ